MLKRTLDGVDSAQAQSTTMAEKFQLGDPSVTLEETMVAVQKASLSFQQRCRSATAWSPPTTTS